MDQFAGIPGSISPEAKRLRWVRTNPARAGEEILLPAYRAEVGDGALVALVGREEVAPGKRLWHLSVSHRGRDGRPGRLPTWDELKSARYQLVHADVPMVLIFPRRTAPYVNVYETCLHLWESDKEIDV